MIVKLAVCWLRLPTLLHKPPWLLLITSSGGRTYEQDVCLEHGVKEPKQREAVLSASHQSRNKLTTLGLTATDELQP